MVDARLRGEWLTAAAHDGLSDPAYRVFHNALMHCNEQGTDGAIALRELRFLYPGPIDQAWLDEIAAAGFWERDDSGYLFVDWGGKLGQSTARDVEAQREKNRERKRNQRAREKQRSDGTPTNASSVARSGTPKRSPVPQRDTDDTSHRESLPPSRRDVTVGVGEERTGQERTGQEESEATIDEHTGEITEHVTSWAVAPIPDDDLWVSPDAPGVVIRGAA